MPKISAKFDWGQPLWGRQMQVGWVKIGDFRQITGYISKGTRQTHISIKVEQEVACALSGTHSRGDISALIGKEHKRKGERVTCKSWTITMLATNWRHDDVFNAVNQSSYFQRHHHHDRYQSLQCPMLQSLQHGSALPVSVHSAMRRRSPYICHRQQTQTHT